MASRAEGRQRRPADLFDGTREALRPASYERRDHLARFRKRYLGEGVDERNRSQALKGNHAASPSREPTNRRSPIADVAFCYLLGVRQRSPLRFLALVLPLPLVFAACGLSLTEGDAQPGDASIDTSTQDRDAASDAPFVDAPTGDSSDGSAPDTSDSPTAPTWDLDWTAIVGTGQSLSIGSQGLPVLSTVPSFDNLKLDDDGPLPRFTDTTSLKLVPLAEPIRPTNLGAPTYVAGVYPANIRGETPHTAMGSQITALAKAAGMANFVSLHSVVGSGGKPMTFIAKNGTGNSYERTLYEIGAFKTFAAASARRLGVGAILLTHGEADAIVPSYEASLVSLQSDYETDLRALTGQTLGIPMFVSQQHSIPRRGEANPRSASTLAAWTASRTAPGKIVCLGPKYQFAYVADHVHMDAFGYRRLGIKHGEAFFQHQVLKKPFRPLEPTTVARVGRTIRVGFFVPVPPLAWDAVLPTPHPEAGHPWASGKGFEVEDSNGPLPIEKVAIVGDTVEITLVDEPTGTTPVVRYAMTMDDTGPAGARAGEGDGRMGLLRDSDPLVGIDDEPLEVDVQTGMDTVLGDFSKHGRYEIVVGPGLPSETAIVTRDATSATLSSPWPGASGKAVVRVHSNQHNYAVAFELPIP